MGLDAVIISSYEDTSFAQSSSLRLKIGGEIATIQRIKASLQNDADSHDANDHTHPITWQHLPKLNGISLFSYLSSAQYNCALIDNFALEKDLFIEHLEQNPRVVIISTTFISNKKILGQLTSQIRALCSDVRIIVGGPLVLSSYRLFERRQDPNYDTDSPRNDYLFLNPENDPAVDYYIIGSQGLDTLLTLMRALENNDSISQIPNLGYFQDGKLCFTEFSSEAPFKLINNDWKALPKRILANRVMSVQASNGCPYQCKFCNFVKDKNATLVRPIDDIIGDLKSLQALGVKYVRFVDDNFRLGKPDLKAFCQKIVDAGISIQWQSFMRLSNLKGMDLKLLKSAGVYEIQFGLESANPDILLNMNKQIDPSRYRYTIEELLAVGINVTASFVIGYPGETLATAQDTIDFIKSIESKGNQGQFRWILFPFMLLPLSPIYEEHERRKYNLSGYMYKWQHASMESDMALDIIKKAYFEIHSSGPGYKGDDIEDLNALTPGKRHAFELARFKLSKTVLSREISPEEIRETFSEILC